MRSASGLTCGLVTASSGMVARLPSSSSATLLHLDQAQLRRREHHQIDAVDRLARSPPGTCGYPPRRRHGCAARRRHHVVEPLRLRRDADHVEQRDRAVARQRRAEMLHLVGSRHAVEPDQRRHLPVVAGEPPDDAAERAPLVQFARREAHVCTSKCRLPVLVEMIAVARRAAGQSRAQRRRPALEIGARAAHAVGVDHHAGVAIGAMLAAHRRHDGLVVDAGVGHQHAERLEGRDGAAFELEHPGLVLELVRGGEIGAARIGDGRNPHAALRRPAGLAQRSSHSTPATPSDSVSAMMWACDTGTKSSAPEIGADLDLMLDRPLHRGPERAGPHRLFVVGQPHRRSFSMLQRVLEMDVLNSIDPQHREPRCFNASLARAAFSVHDRHATSREEHDAMHSFSGRGRTCRARDAERAGAGANIRASRSPSSCRSPPAARPTSSPAWSASTWAARSARRSSSRTSAAPAAASA